ncbi:hypothetical protein GCK72_006857 [Caenorhabditis remanei]|uniref:BTB domain-containing protein n=1 Tax=Caenorhabditis remanei TaxID=31234 RepID=A0A6A5HHP8_CAERE|nr:hypothetical protein GCK72_006857 [Caenorhabditis remanei]KAF1766899.1 hypothetical protein GCK72_006857 [Caenorhabditis remanei]
MAGGNNKISSENNEEGGSAPKRQRIEAENNQNAENNTNDQLPLTLRMMYDTCQEVLEKQKNIVEKLRLADEKLESIQLQLKSDIVDKKTAISSNSPDNKDSVNATTPSDSSQKTIPSDIMPTTGKHFVLKYKLKNVSEMVEDDGQYLEAEEHFGVECKNAHTWGWEKFIEWAEMEKDFLVDDMLTVETHVKIGKTTGIYKDNLRSFDETMEEFSDVVLVVNEQKFYVLKLYLSVQSSYFNALFLGQFRESKKSEVKLTGVDADDFQNYLELLYGDDSIDEFTVEGLLLVGDMYDTAMVIRKCEQFLLKESKKTLKKKLELSTRYSLEALKKKCLAEIKSIGDLQAVLPENVQDLDKSIMGELLEKSISLHN